MVDRAPGRQVAGKRDERPPLLRSMLGDVLRRTRLRQRRTLADVARAARVSVPYLSELERGRKEASSEVLAAVCDALRLDLADLLAEAWRSLARRSEPARRHDLTRRRELAEGRDLAARRGLAEGRDLAAAGRGLPGAGRDLPGERALPTETIRLGNTRDGEALAPVRRPGDPQCLLAA